MGRWRCATEVPTEGGYCLDRELSKRGVITMPKHVLLASQSIRTQQEAVFPNGDPSSDPQGDDTNNCMST